MAGVGEIMRAIGSPGDRAPEGRGRFDANTIRRRAASGYCPSLMRKGAVPQWELGDRWVAPPMTAALEHEDVVLEVRVARHRW